MSDPSHIGQWQAGLLLCDNPVDNIPTQLYILLYRQNTLHHHIHIMMEHILHVEYLYQVCQLPIFMPNYGSSCYDQLCHDLWRESLRSTAALHWVSINHNSIITPGGWPDDFVNDYILQTLLQCNFEPKLFVDTHGFYKSLILAEMLFHFWLND